MPEPPSTDSQQQVVPAQPTAFVRKVIGIGSTRYIAIPPPVAAILDLRVHDYARWTLGPNSTLTLEKHANGPRHA